LRKERRPGWSNILLATVIFGTGMLTVLPARAAEDPDELYRQGRFAEAGKRYARSDMDHPRDLRYRYNRGCADYQAGDYKGAAAAFSSVLRRAKDRETRFKAAYNLGNTAFKQGDATSAVVYYKQALRTDPDSENARYNLEIALRKLKEQEKKEQAQQKPDGQDGKQSDSGKEGKKGKDGEKKSAGASPEKEGDRDKPPEENKNDGNAPGEEKKPDERKETGQAQDRNMEKAPQDLSGDLKPRQDLPRQGEKAESPGQKASLMDRQKAEALLDNVKEDRSRFLELQAREKKHRGISSGKDW